MPKSKKFIDKKDSVTFHLVHRSQQDPLAADETAPQRVLVPVESQPAKAEKKKLPEAELKKRKEEQQKYGIFFDDDYDYLQHMRDVSKLPVEWVETEQPENSKKDKSKKNQPKINLPSSVFASEVEEEVGLLNRAAPIFGPRLDLDPDVVAAMDEDFDYNDPDNQLEDDFIALANAEMSDEEFNEEDEYGSDVSSENMAMSDEERDEVASLNGPQYSFMDEETKSRFTDYSMSSSVIRRNEQLTLLDDRFERMFAQYDEDEIGPLDYEEIEGTLEPNSETMMQCIEEYEKEKNEANDNVIKLMKDRLKIIEQYDSESDDGLEKQEVQTEKDRWDCESILTTYSNIYNHPKLISEPKKLNKIKIDKRTGIPQGVLDNKPGQLTIKNLAQLDAENETNNRSTNTRSVAGTMKSILSVLSERPPNETPEDRRERKKALKEYRKERREERKANKEAFKEEKKRQEKIMLNNKKNIQGNRLL